jgi:hypothetical protein
MTLPCIEGLASGRSIDTIAHDLDRLPEAALRIEGERLLALVGEEKVVGQLHIHLRAGQ